MRQEELTESWIKFIRYCEQLGHGEIEKLKIQDGLPVLAEVTRQKVKFAANGNGGNEKKLDASV